MSKARTLAVLSAIFAFGLFSSAAASGEEDTPTGTIAVQVLGVQGTEGKVCVAIYDDADSYPDDDGHYKVGCSKITDGKAFVVFKDIPPGDYAAFAFHDADGNGKIKKNFIGMPKEGVGASRGAKGFMGPPKFQDAKFAVGLDKKFIQIRLKYL